MLFHCLLNIWSTSLRPAKSSQSGFTRASKGSSNFILSPMFGVVISRSDPRKKKKTFFSSDTLLFSHVQQSYKVLLIDGVVNCIWKAWPPNRDRQSDLENWLNRLCTHVLANSFSLSHTHTQQHLNKRQAAASALPPTLPNQRFECQLSPTGEAYEVEQDTELLPLYSDWRPYTCRVGR